MEFPRVAWHAVTHPHQVLKCSPRIASCLADTFAAYRADRTNAIGRGHQPQRAPIVGHGHEADEVGLPFGHAAVDVKWLRTVEGLDAQAIATCQVLGRGCLAGADRPTNPEDVRESWFLIWGRFRAWGVPAPRLAGSWRITLPWYDRTR